MAAAALVDGDLGGYTCTRVVVDADLNNVGFNAEVDKAIEEKARELNQVLPKLFISTAYREWLEKQEEEHPEHALPIPRYLRRKK